MKEPNIDEKVQIGLYLPSILLDKIRDQALREDRSLNNIMVKALKEAFFPELLPDLTEEIPSTPR